MISTQKPFSYKSESAGLNQFSSGERVGFTDKGAFLVDATTQGGGGFFTVIPVSPSEHRKKHPTKFNVERKSDSELIVYSDWGEPYFFRGDGEFLDELEKDCRTQEVGE